MPIAISKPKSALSKPNIEPGEVIPCPADKFASAPQYSDEALALRFAELHASDMRYVPLRDHWLHFDGKRWRPDETLISTRFAREVCRSAAAECGSPSLAHKLASSGTIHAVERLARADKRLAATIDQFDFDPWLLNTPGGVIDLRTGKPRAHEATDYCTKITAVSPGGDCPLWKKFLTQIFDGDQELIDYMQRGAGYVLTGSTVEHVLFFCHGTGANGKSTLVNTLSGIMGGYCAVAQMETFTASNADRHPTELAMLRGARLVTANETEQGRRWAEARIKSVTGGDPITARQMRQDPFTFLPQFKLVMAGNHKPGLGGVDEAIRRRIHLIPFAIKIPEGDRDPALPEKLKAEWPGILAWMIEGCQKWQSTTLKAPDAVKKATETYLESEDALGQWLEECCEKGPDYWTGSSALFVSWKAWADGKGESSLSQRRFVQALESKGFQQQRKAKARGFVGVRLNAFAVLQNSGMTLVTSKIINGENHNKSL
jgi:putative DNA primase/helicase